ncbi:hypothetical protein [Pectinatus frisingensis]|uniref:hypothetical protein n=1 Tax=Pectinatus frisingensis TaxID=865 RepID=UPI0018C7DF46|nr:hypothetical protein [Pectinatus frisingensis]
MQLTKDQRNQLDRMIINANEHKRIYKQDVMIVLAPDVGFQGYGLRDDSIYPIVYRTDTQELAPEFSSDDAPDRDSARPFISERFERCL